MKNIFFFFLFSCFFTQVEGQINLVKNPSLEAKDTCPWLVDQIKIAKHWSCIDTAYVYLPADTLFFGNPDCSPEYVNTCAVSGCCRVPNVAYKNCRTGDGMAWMYMYSDQSYPEPYYRDYLLGRLYSPLVAGQSYCVTFYVVMDKGSAYAVNHIGAYFDDGSIDTNSYCGLPHPEYVPQVVDTTIINDTANWTKIQGSFIANGTEKYITIGNFYDSAHTSKIKVRPGIFGQYLLDDVSVIASNTPAYAGPDVSMAAGDSVYVGVDSNGEGMPCCWYVLGGTSPIDSGGRILVKPSNTTSYVVVMDLCGVLTYDTVVVGVVPLTSPGLSKGEEVLRVWPNPVGDRVYIANAKGCEVRVYDMISREVKRLICEKDDEEMYTGDLLPGVYIVEIMTTEGERRVVRLLKK